MKLNTKYHGIKEYNENEIITFYKGLPGFKEHTKFIIFPVEENEVFNILHSVEDATLGFVVISPFYAVKDYEFKLSDETLKELNIETPEEVLVLNTVTLSSNVENITTNLQAPIVVNIKKKLGEQIILSNEKYQIKYPLFQK